ncbi:MAG TPA: DAK2 domain-containing protein, partial [Acidimicrobiales bacterium]|nr:DAK2 domain-containing protein [Acidimicrobiales bacterium]
MPVLERLAASDLTAVMVAFGEALRAHQTYINRLNVYPVPDGDTGTNMALTLESVVTGLDGVPRDGVKKAVVHGSLMGARGNSGVILSQILRGLVQEAKERDALDPALLAAGLQAAAEGAYSAVQNPVEGTILTVIRAAAEGAAAADGAGLDAVLAAAHQSASEALARTPELLPVLKAAGVVDSGGTGLLLLLDAFLHVAAGRPLPDPPALPAGETVAGASVPEHLTGHAEG